MAINAKKAAEVVYNHCKSNGLKKIKEDEIMNILKKETGDYCFKMIDNIVKSLESDFSMKKQTMNFAAHYKDEDKKTTKNDHFFNESYLIVNK